MKIPFNKPYLTGKEQHYISQVASPNMELEEGAFNKRCANFLQEKYSYKAVRLTATTKDAYQMAAILSGVQPGDEVIMPAYSNVMLANAFISIGAVLKLADSTDEAPNVDYETLKIHLTEKTRVIVVNHYAGNACSMAAILRLANEYKIKLIEDAGDALDAKHRGENVGKVGCLSVFSFDSTKSIAAGDVGALVINDEELINAADDLIVKGTAMPDRLYIPLFYAPGEMNCAYLLAQLEAIDEIQRARLNEWINYYNDLETLKNKGLIDLPRLSFEDRPNGQTFYIVCANSIERNELITFLRARDIDALTHYKPLHTAQEFIKRNGVLSLPNAEKYGEGLLRLPMFFQLDKKQRKLVTNAVRDYYKVK